MTPPAAPGGGGRRRDWRAAGLFGVTALQALCAVFFVGDVIADLRLVGFGLHTVAEGAVALALAAGVVLGGVETRRTLERSRRAETAASAAAGAFAEVVAAHFERWALSPAEREVALFALKGFDPSEIARLRGTAQGTIRAQLARVYAKAGVSSRAELAAVFIDDLLGGPLASAAEPPPPPAGRATAAKTGAAAG